MSGHSKWATIRHKKGAQDAKRGKMFTKLIKEITVAARMGGADLEANPRLRTVVLKAKAANMPKDNIERAIKKGTGDLEGVEYTEIVYEAYGPGGVAFLIETLTDNKNRTAADVRNIVNKSGGNMGSTGSVAYLFSRKGIISFDAEKYTEEEIFEAALEAGAEDVSNQGGSIEVVTEPDDFEAILQSLEDAGFTEHPMAEVTMVPETTISLHDETTKQNLRMVQRLEDTDDVQNVSTNLDIPDDLDYSSEE